ncbi:YraN family protein [Rhizobium halophytocola]|uniref:UPF0102 protein J2Z17_002845 n=1 Tax=Rhizobium halophytocola TaxID=735519 RepID=A0ABS4E0D4_9HYPH|nr:YraN family protein [Rhizobium halophytocola]MBP1851400.1 putative endonuclease [Rhizobium halophytocola]
MAPDAAQRRRRAERRGHLAEWIAALYLLLHGYRILAIRYRTKLGEIDLIVRKGDLVAFVEVKQRADPAAAVDAVSFTAQKRIRAAGDLWLSRRRDAACLSLRYDIVTVSRAFRPRHLKDAF